MHNKFFVRFSSQTEFLAIEFVLSRAGFRIHNLVSQAALSGKTSSIGNYYFNAKYGGDIVVCWNYDGVAAKQGRELNGIGELIKFLDAGGGKVVKTYTVYLREIRVVPVVIQATDEEDAKDKVRAGDGEYIERDARPSDLSANEYFDIFGERPIELTKD